LNYIESFPHKLHQQFQCEIKSFQFPYSTQYIVYNICYTGLVGSSKFPLVHDDIILDFWGLESSLQSKIICIFLSWTLESMELYVNVMYVNEYKQNAEGCRLEILWKMGGLMS
jgi:hypothetical protein